MDYNTNYWDKVVQYQKDKTITINGNNFSGSGKFSSLTTSNGSIIINNDLQEKKEILSIIEQYTKNIYNRAGNEYTPSPMEIKVVNGVEIATFSPDSFSHVSKPNMQAMESISTCGFLASEWFGFKEAEIEAPYCSFLRTNELINQNMMCTRSPDSVVFFLDCENPIMQHLLNHDFYKYIFLYKKAKNNPELIEKLNIHYGKLAIVYEYIIKNEGAFDIIGNSLGFKQKHNTKGVDVTTREFSIHRTKWHAILGGIPPQFINGIRIKSGNKELNNHIEEVYKLFPNAVIFNEYNMVIHNSNQKFSDEEISIAKIELQKSIDNQDDYNK